MPAETPDPDRGAPNQSAFENWHSITFLGLPRWYAWASSVTFHALAVTAMATVTFPSVAHVRTEEPKAVPTVLKIGEKLYLVSRVLPAPSPRPSKAPRAPAPKAQQAPAPQITAPAPPARAEAPRVFAPPEVRRNVVTEATVIQPLSPPDLVFPQVQPLPSFQIQATQTIRTPKPFVVPGRPTPRPVVETPNLPPPPQQLELARAAPVIFAPRSTLVLPPGPQQVIDARPPDLTVTTEAVARVGDPVSILSLSDVPVPPKPEIVVPPGNVLGRTGDGIVITTGTAAAGGTVVSTVAGGPAAEGAAGPGRGAPRPSAEATLPNSGRPGPATGAPGGPPAPPPLKPNQMRRPADGQFDAVVVQNTPTDQFLESRGLLTGRPIYSVYISLGTAKDWTLYFTVPGSAPPQQTGTRVVAMNSVTPILAPYPTLIERPITTIPAFFKYVLVQATIDDSGHFQGLKIVRSTRPEADKVLLAALANWIFRPASREGKNIAVEVLLHVPVDGL